MVKNETKRSSLEQYGKESDESAQYGSESSDTTTQEITELNQKHGATASNMQAKNDIEMCMQIQKKNFWKLQDRI